MVESRSGDVSPDDRTVVAGPPKAPHAHGGQTTTTGASSPPKDPLPAPTPAPPAEGLPFGRYLLRRELGRGGFGVVHEAWDTQLGRTVALKRILARSQDDPEAADRQVREARAAAGLRHPSIVTVYDVGEADGCPYFTMELIDGRGLEDHLRDQDAWTTLPMRRRVEILAQVGEALGYAHAHGIVHRDVKPSNVMIDASGRAMLMDFGLAKPLPGSPGFDELTASGTVIGTLHYMSPEQAEGQGSLIGPASDVFSLGVILYRMITGAFPFEGEGMQALLATLTKEPIPPSRRSPRVQRDLETVTMRCLEKDPLRRFADASKLAAELRRWLDGEPILSRPIGWTERTVRRASKHRAAVVFGSLVLIFALATLNAWRQFRMSAEIAERTKKEKAAVEAREKAQRDAWTLLEEARPALASARRLLHDDGAPYGALATRIASAQRTIERAILACPELPLGHHLMGESWEALGWDDRAEACYEEALRRDSAFAPSKLRLGRLCLGRAFLATTGGSDVQIKRSRGAARAWADRARERIDAALSATSGFDGPLDREVALAMVAYAAGDRPRAAALCEEALRAHPGEDGREELLWLSALSRIETAPVASLDEAISIRPKYALARFTRAMLKELLGDARGALEDLSVAVEWNPRFVQAFCNRGNLRSAGGDREGAISDFEAAIAIDPAFPPARVNRGRLRAEDGDGEGAIEDYDAAIASDPECAEAYINRADVWLERGDDDRALADSDKALVLAPGHPMAHVNRANARIGKGDLDGALADCEAALRADPTDSAAYTCRGSIRRERGDLDGALADFDESIRLAPSLEAHFDRGQVWLEKGDRAKALADYDEAVRIGPGRFEAWAHRGTLRAQMGDVDAGLSDLEEALERNARCAMALTNRGVLRIGKGDVEGGMADFDAAVEADPGYVEGWRNRGAQRLLMGDSQGAVADFERLIEVAPADWPGRGEALWLLDQAKRRK